MTMSLFMVMLLTQSPVPQQLPEPQCINAYGMIQCGYDCKAAYGQIACAQTPFGACIAAYGQVQCGDPPPWILRWPQEQIPRMRCHSAFGQIRCGYGCVSANGQVACAQTPWGKCHAAYGQVQCFESTPMRRHPAWRF